MGGILEGGIGIANKSSPYRAAIEKVEAELRNEYDVREERKRELEFLEKGGNPLDFKLGNAASASVQSTSLTNLQPDLGTSKPKGSFALTASLYGDSVESSGRLAAALCEPNTADNLMLFDPEHEYSEGDQNSFHPVRGNVVPPEHSSKRDGSHKTREHGDSSAFGLHRKAYKRRYRSHANRDGARSGSSDINPALGFHGSSLPSHHSPENVVGLLSDVENLDVSSNCNSKPGKPIDGTLCCDVCVDDHRFVELNDAKAVGSTEDLIKVVSTHSALDATASNPQGLIKPSFSNAEKTPMKMDFNEPAALQSMEEMASVVVEDEPRAAAGKVENHSSCQMNGFVNKKGDAITNDAHNGNAARHRNGFDSWSSCSQTNLDVDRNNDAETGTRISTIDSNGDVDSQNLGPENLVVGERETKEAKLIDTFSGDEESASACLSHRQNGHLLQPQEETIQVSTFLHGKLTNQSDINGIEAGGCIGSGSARKSFVPFVEKSSPQSEMFCTVIHNSIADLPEAGLSSKVSTTSFNVQTPGSLKLARVDEESILKEAEIIEAKRKRIAELSTLTLPLDIPRKSHWDYVLEEMAWLASDFAQERIWKLAACSQICNRAAFCSRVRKQEKSSSMKAKIVARTLARAVMEFWHSVEISKELEQPSQKDGAPAVQSYMARFLKYNNSNLLHYQADVQRTLDKVSDSGILDMSWEDSLTEENLFYAIPMGAMVTYKKSIESLVAHYERIGSNVRDEMETSACDLVADNSYYEDDGDTCTFGMPVASEYGKSSKFGQKKRKYSAHVYGARAYGICSDYLPLNISENKIVTQQPALHSKRPSSNLNVSIPIKRMRTASRRILSPFSAGPSGCIQLPNKTDASSGDTNSFQDDQSTLRGGSSFPINLEVESGGEFEKNLAFDSAEVSTKPKNKKKTSSFEQRWHIDSNFHNDQFQRDHSKKRSDSYQFESNGCNGIFGQSMTKKIIQPSQDGSLDNTSTVAGHVPSPVASQMSNMYHPSKFYKMLGGRERFRKAKVLKMPTGQPGSGTPWSLFEDQALVVMVHDMGPNWELVSDAFNSTMQFKCIFRNAKECKERHNILMDKTSGDGAESAEDSGSSQPYPSTLPGIPKGSARQLFQHLKEPMEEDALRYHRDKIILIGQKLHYHKTQDPKQLQPPHSSHTMALSQACPNNMGGGSVLSPLDLCDAIVFGADMPSLGHQGTYSRGLILSNQSAGASTHPTSGASSALQGSSNMMLGNNFPSSPGPLSSVRDGRYGAPRPASLSIDENQRIQQYNQMVSGRNGQQSNLSSCGALPGIDRGVRVPPSGSGVGKVCISGSTPMARHGLHGVASSSSVNSGSMVSANMHPGVRSGPGHSNLRPREGSPMMRPGLSQDSQRQTMTPDLQTQVSPVSNQVMSHFGGLSSPFANQTLSPPVSSYPLHHQQSHQISPQQGQVPSPRHPHFQGLSNHASHPQQQAYAIRLAKERQLQQSFLQQQPSQQQQFAASNSSISPVQPQPHLPVSSAVQNSPLVQSPANSLSVSVSPFTSPSSVNAMSQQQQKLHTPTQGVIRNAQTGGSYLTNQTSTHRQKQQQPLIQTNRQHPQQRQQSQSQQQAKSVKGVGRGNMMIHQNIQIDPTILNGSLMEAEDSYTASSVNLVPPTRQYTSSQLSNQPLPQQKKYSGQATSSSKHLQQMISHSDTNQGNVPPIAPAPGLRAAHQSVTPLVAASSNHPQVISHQKFMNQSQLALQKVVQSNHQFSSEVVHTSHPRGSDTYQNSTSNSTEMEATSLPQNQWHTSEPVNESNVLKSATNLGSLELVSKPANTSEIALQSSQGHGLRLSSANLIPITHDLSSQWQQPQVQHSHSSSPSPQQQSQIHQAGNANFYGTPSDARLE